jgi:hypothetical protein
MHRIGFRFSIWQLGWKDLGAGSKDPMAMSGRFLAISARTAQE